VSGGADFRLFSYVSFVSFAQAARFLAAAHKLESPLGLRRRAGSFSSIFLP
jgi:hypothetical protein